MMGMLKALLIDDEAPSREYLREMLSVHPDIEVVGEADALEPARELVAQTPFDVVFLDVKLGPATGFDLLSALPPDKPVIFVTGYEQHAHRAFEVNAVDYLVKPVRAARLAESLRRLAAHRRKQRPASRAPFPPSTQLRPGDPIALHSGQRTEFARVADISLIVAHENYSFVHCSDGRQVLVRRSLKSWAASLPAADFLRVHRTVLVNLAHIRSYERRSSRQLLLRIAGVEQPVAVSRDATPEVKTRLQARFPMPQLSVALAQ